MGEFCGRDCGTRSWDAIEVQGVSEVLVVSKSCGGVGGNDVFGAAPGIRRLEFGVWNSGVGGFLGGLGDDGRSTRGAGEELFERVRGEVESVSENEYSIR